MISGSARIRPARRCRIVVDMSTTTPAPTTRPIPAPPTGTRLWWVDAVRAGSLAVVVLGHFLIALVQAVPGGELQVGALLDEAAWSHPLTWLLQVMACFFAVGGVVAAGRTPITSVGAWASWMTGRVRGLVAPTVPLLALWVLAAPLLSATFGADVVGTASQAALVPLWFLAVYLLIQAITPVWVAVVDRVGVARPVAALLLGVAMVDAAHLAGTPFVGFANFVLVWSIPTVLGIAAGQGRLSARSLLRLAAVALSAALLLVPLLGYAVPVVGVTGTARSNNSPPSLLLALHGLAYASAVLALAPRAERALSATRRRRAVLAAAGRWSMGVYLWHMTGLVVLVAIALVTTVPGVDALLALEPLTAGWWMARPLFMALALVPTVALIALSGPAVRLLTRLLGRAPVGPVAVTMAVMAWATGLAILITAGVTPFAVTPLALLAGGTTLLAAGGRTAG